MPPRRSRLRNGRELRGAGADSRLRRESTVREPRLYQLIRQPAAIGDRTLSIEFADTGVEAYSFTFG